jgi:hypothetical protein
MYSSAGMALRPPYCRVPCGVSRGRSVNGRIDRARDSDCVVDGLAGYKAGADDGDRSVSPPVRRPDTTRRGMVYGAWWLLSS